MPEIGGAALYANHVGQDRGAAPDVVANQARHGRRTWAGGADLARSPSAQDIALSVQAFDFNESVVKRREARTQSRYAPPAQSSVRTSSAVP